jgi:hypothetical protein
MIVMGVNQTAPDLRRMNNQSVWMRKCINANRLKFCDKVVNSVTFL